VADPEFYNGGGRSRGGVWGVPPPQKKRIFTWNRWVLVHSRITFYVYAKTGQVNGGGRPPPWIATVAGHCVTYITWNLASFL